MLSPGCEAGGQTTTIGVETREEIMALVLERYADFGPTLSCKKLVEDQG